MKRFSAPRFWIGGLLALSSPLSSTAFAQPRGAQNFALPSDIIAREIAFARAVREKGQWSSFRAFAAKDAQMFAGDAPVLVHGWTQGKRDPATPLQWQTHAVWMSCDGALAVSYGAWQSGDKAHGWFSTIWQREKKGDYRFILDQGDDTPQALPEPEWLDAKVADCPARAAKPAPAPNAPLDHLNGEAPDHSLAWTTTLRSDGGHDYVLRVKTEGALREVLRKSVAASK